MWSILLVACSGENTVAAPSPARPAAPAPAPDPDGPDPASFQGTTGAVDKPFSGTGSPLLQKVQGKRRDGFDRASFEFSGSLPGYHLEYIDKSALTQCGSGAPVAVAGDAWLSLRFSPAAAHTEDGTSTVGFQELKGADLHLKAMRELHQLCDFEGVVVWVVGVSSPRPYRVTERQDPPRLLVDVEQ